MKELIIKKCRKCGALVEILEDCTCDNCGIKCCGEEMEKLIPNTVEASAEKHLPICEAVGDTLLVEVPHVMEENHYIEWICMSSDKIVGKKFLKPGEKAKVTFPYIPGSTVYAYCNTHELWSTNVN